MPKIITKKYTKKSEFRENTFQPEIDNDLLIKVNSKLDEKLFKPIRIILNHKEKKYDKSIIKEKILDFFKFNFDKKEFLKNIFNRHLDYIAYFAELEKNRLSNQKFKKGSFCSIEFSKKHHYEFFYKKLETNNSKVIKMYIYYYLEELLTI